MTDINTVKAVSYYRKITQQDSTDKGLRYKQQAVTNYAKKNKMEIIKEFSDFGYSPIDNVRPKLKEMLDYISSSHQNIEHIVMYTVNRATQDLRGNTETMFEILKLVKSVKFVEPEMSIDSEDFMKMLKIYEFAQHEKEIFLKRMAEGKKAVKSRGL